MKLVTSAGFGFPYRDAFPDGHVASICRKHGVNHRKRIFPPETVINLWVAQIIAGGQSCSDAVARLSAFYAVRGRTISAGTGGYVQARQRLSLAVIKDLVRLSARRLETDCHEYRPIIRPLWTVDGSTSPMPSTESNCEQYPKSKALEPGLGLPLTRYISINSATTGAILGLRIGAMSGKGTGESSLFRDAWVDLERGDVVVGDRAYSIYGAMALLRHQGVDLVCRSNANLKTADLPSVKRLGRHDRIVELKKTKASKAMPRQLEKMIPPSQLVRVTRYRADCNGRESGPIRLVSSLCSPEFTTVDLANIFAERWKAETDFRSFKIDLKAERLRCQSPEMVEKELYMAALANNVVRIFMARAAKYAGVSPREISFRRTMHFLDRYAPKFDQANLLDRGRLMKTMLGLISENRVGNRQGRYEPRALKQVGASYGVLKHPRHEARRKRLYHGIDKRRPQRKRPS